MIKSLSYLTAAMTLFCAILVQAQQADTLWTRAYGGPNGEGAYAIDRTSDGAYIVAGEKEPSRFGSTDVYLMKIDQNGDTLWTRTFGEPNTNEIGRSVRQTSDGGFIVAGYAGVGQSNEVYLLKTDSQGNFEWDATYGLTPDNRGHGVRQTSDGGYIIVGQAYIVRGPFGSYDGYIVKTDAQGNLEWERFMGDVDAEFLLSVAELQGGGYIMTGQSQLFGGWDAYLIRLSAAGDSLWARSVGGSAADVGTDILELPDRSGFVFTGISVALSRGDGDVWLARTDTLGQIVWSQTYGGNSDDDGQALAMTPDGGYIVVGMGSSFGDLGWNVYVIKTDSLGNDQWSRNFGLDGDDRGHDVVVNPDGSFGVAGWTTSFGGGWLDVYVIKFEGDLTGAADNGIGGMVPRAATLGQNYPNPFNTQTRIEYSLSSEAAVTIEIFDILGRRVAMLADGPRPAGRHSVVWDASGRPSGVYAYRIAGADGQTKRMTLLK